MKLNKNYLVLGLLAVIGFALGTWSRVPKTKHPMTVSCISITGAHPDLQLSYEDTIILDHTGFYSIDGKVRYYPGFGEGCILVDGLPRPRPPQPGDQRTQLPHRGPLTPEELLSPDPDHGVREALEPPTQIHSI